jgi:ZIP family zinc transporter
VTIATMVAVWAALAWGFVGASSLLVGALIAYVARPGPKLIGLVMAVGTGLLMGSVSFELIGEAIDDADVRQIGVVTLAGAFAFIAGDWWLDQRGARDRKDPGGDQADGAPLAIVLGSVLDGIPESFVLGLTVLEGGVSVALLAGVLLSNLPEGLSSSSGLRAAGWPRDRVVLMWSAVVAVSALSATAGYALLDPGSEHAAALVQGFAAGGLLAMLSDTLLPEAFDVEGILTGGLVTIGFAVALILSGI